MKKIIKKLGVIGLALAVLIPFMDLPKVKAANDDCQYHLQNYLFLDVNGLYAGNILDVYSSKGYQTTTQFPFEFPQGTEIVKVTSNNVTTDDNIHDYFLMHNSAIEKSKNNEYYKIDTDYKVYGNSFVTTLPEGSKYNTSAILLHGEWSNYDANFNPISNSWDKLNDENIFKIHTIQKNIDYSGISTTINRGKYENNSEVPDSEIFDTKTLQNLIDDVDGAVDESLLSYNISAKKYFMPISITRKLSNASDLSDKKFGYATNDGTLFVFGNIDGVSGADGKTKADTLRDGGKSVKDIVDDSIKNSYDSYKEWIESTEYKENGGRSKDCIVAGKCIQVGTVEKSTFDNNPSTTANIDFDVYGSYYWPFVLSVEYKTCSTSEDPTEGNWNLKYDANADGNPVNNIPDEVTNIALNATVDVAEGPTRDGWTFKQWCTNPNGSGQCVNAGGKITSDKSKTVILYAQWGQTGTTTNGKTGIVSYIISFVAVGAIAGGIYYVSKKKNLFKQI